MLTTQSLNLDGLFSGKVAQGRGGRNNMTMGDWLSKEIVRMVRQAPDEVILDLVRDKLQGGFAVGGNGGGGKAAPVFTGGVSLENSKLSFEEAGRVVLVSIKAPGGNQIRIPDRASSRLMLWLAQARQADVAKGLPQASAGWRTSEEVGKALSIAREHLNVLVFRARGAFAKAGVGDAGNIIERRPRTSELRIGVPANRLEIV
jgi:hypothetical protein